MTPNPAPDHRRLVANLLALTLGMFALAYASVPLYRLFCDVTGYGGTTRKGTAPVAVATDRMLNIQFNADTDPGLAWHFAPLQKSMQVRIGESSLAHYEAKNLTQNPISGHATYNVLPYQAGRYFVKVACFCFTEQTLPGRKRVDMPVSFYIDPAILQDPELADVKTITLSYTFFPLQK